jgi:hypothetical protein
MPKQSFLADVVTMVAKNDNHGFLKVNVLGESREQSLNLIVGLPDSTSVLFTYLLLYCLRDFDFTGGYGSSVEEYPLLPVRTVSEECTAAYVRK